MRGVRGAAAGGPRAAAQCGEIARDVGGRFVSGTFRFAFHNVSTFYAARTVPSRSPVTKWCVRHFEVNLNERLGIRSNLVTDETVKTKLEKPTGWLLHGLRRYWPHSERVSTLPVLQGFIHQN